MTLQAWAVVPVLDEVDAIEGALAALPDSVRGAVVVDGGSTDGTAEAAERAGATVVTERVRGYGRAVMRGVEVARARGAGAYLVFDGNGTAARADLERVLAPVLDGTAELSVGVRPAASMRPAQRLGNRFATEVVARRWGVRFGDVGAIRAVTDGALARLALDELGYGWPLQLLARAAARGIATAQIPVVPRPRRGASKVSGTVRGTAGASSTFLRLLAVECLLGRAGLPRRNP